MAKQVVTARKLLVGSLDLSGNFNEVQIHQEAPAVEVTNFASGGNYEGLGGIKTGTLAVEWIRDDALSGLDAAINTAGIGGTLAFEIRQKNSAVGTDNPKRTGTVIITQWQGISGSVGQAFSNSTSWPTTGAITRAIS